MSCQCMPVHVNACQCMPMLSQVISKKYPDSKLPIHDFFLKAYGPVGSPTFKVAQQNFIGSMAAYSIVCYLLQVHGCCGCGGCLRCVCCFCCSSTTVPPLPQIKDRHDGNILLKRDGSIVHIDFGWMLGKVMPMNIEASAPFKLTADMAAVMREGRWVVLKRDITTSHYNITPHHYTITSHYNIASQHQ